MSSHPTTKLRVTSRDGTDIGLLRQGEGPGVVLVQGAGSDAYSYTDLAEALSPHLTVLRPDRRGRGMSPKPYDHRHSVARDVEDLDAVLEGTGATQVFGLSSGAMVTLEAARTLPRITSVAVYEPPFYPDGISHAGVDRLDAEIERGDLASALVSAFTLADTAPAPLQALPRPLARLLALGALRVSDRGDGPSSTLRQIVPGLRYDFNVVGGMDGKMASFASIAKPVLLLSGTKSAAYLRHGIRELARTLPRAQHVEYDGLDHSGPWNDRRGVGPRRVAATLREFFASAL